MKDCSLVLYKMIQFVKGKLSHFLFPHPLGPPKSVSLFPKRVSGVASWGLEFFQLSVSKRLSGADSTFWGQR